MTKQAERKRAVRTRIYILGGVALLLSGVMTVGTVIAGVDLNPDQPGDESVARTAKDVQAPPIMVDVTAATSDSTAGSTLTFSLTVADNANRLLAIGAHGRDTAAVDCDVTGVTYNGVAATVAVATVTASGPFVCAEIWYLSAPATGANDVVVTWAGTLDRRAASATALYNVAQQAPEVTSSKLASATASVTTTATTTTDSAWLIDAATVDVVGSGFAIGEVLQTERYDQSVTDMAAAQSTRPANAAGAKDMTWTNDSAEWAHVVAAFAEAQ